MRLPNYYTMLDALRDEFFLIACLEVHLQIRQHRTILLVAEPRHIDQIVQGPASIETKYK